MTVDRHRPFSCIDDAADDADECRLACPVRAEQRKYLAAAKAQVDARKGVEPGGVGLG